MQKGNRLIMAMVMSWMLPAIATAEMRPNVCVIPASESAREEPVVAVGADKDRVWLESTIEGLRIRKFTQKGGASVLELRHGNDTIVISVAPGHISALRDGTTVVVDPTRPASADEMQDFLASSRAITRARRVYSRLERQSGLKAPQMSLAASLAFVAALTGDVAAPERLGERFASLHMGRVRPVRSSASCWSDYTTETNAAMDDYFSCLYEASQGSIIWQEPREWACYATWILRVEAAWFEFLKCTGAPLVAG